MYFDLRLCGHLSLWSGWVRIGKGHGFAWTHRSRWLFSIREGHRGRKAGAWAFQRLRPVEPGLLRRP